LRPRRDSRSFPCHSFPLAVRQRIGKFANVFWRAPASPPLYLGGCCLTRLAPPVPGPVPLFYLRQDQNCFFLVDFSFHPPRLSPTRPRGFLKWFSLSPADCFKPTFRAAAPLVESSVFFSTSTSFKSDPLPTSRLFPLLFFSRLELSGRVRVSPSVPSSRAF